MSHPETGSEIVHGTAIALAEAAALIRGPSGAGKSDLALRCLMTAPSPLISVQAELVADDRVVLTLCDGDIRASPPPGIAGKLEIRGIGIIPVQAVKVARLALVVDLVAPSEVERYPLSRPSLRLLGRQLPLLRLAPFEASAAAKLLTALALGRDLFASP